jgi:hypothetical protein
LKVLRSFLKIPALPHGRPPKSSEIHAQSKQQSNKQRREGGTRINQTVKREVE